MASSAATRVSVGMRSVDAAACSLATMGSTARIGPGEQSEQEHRRWGQRQLAVCEQEWAARHPDRGAHGPTARRDRRSRA
jgi:hypothetical protein